MPKTFYAIIHLYQGMRNGMAEYLDPGLLTLMELLEL